MRRVIVKNIKPFLAILGLVAIAAVVGIYILQQQRLRIPFIDEEPMRVNIELSNAQAVTPGQGQTVQVSGVKIGDIGEVKLVDGVAVVGMDIEQKFKDLIHTDAEALLRPRTGLKDMYIQLFPGSDDEPVVEEGFTIPVRNTLTDVDLDEILSELDDRTRDYVELLVHGAGRGLEGRGEDLAEVFERFGPTAEDLARLNRTVASEREALSGLVTSLARLNRRLAEQPQNLSQLVDAGAEALGGFAAEEDQLRATLDELPPTLRQARQTLRAARPFAREAGPTLDALIPAVRELDDANAVIEPFAEKAAPIVEERIRPFVRETRPLVADLAPAAQGLAEAFPDLGRFGQAFNKVLNLVAFNQNGREGPNEADRDEGYLFWFAWTSHTAINLFNTADANGLYRPIFLTGTCGTLTTLVNEEPALEFAMGLSPLLATLCEDPDTASTDVQRALRSKGYDDKAKKEAAE